MIYLPHVLRTIRWRLVALSLLSVGIPLLLMATNLNRMLWDFYINQLRQQLTATAALTGEMAASAMEESADKERLSSIVDRWDHHMGMRFVICDSAGRVMVATSNAQSLKIGEKVTEQTAPGMLDALEGSVNTTTWRRPDRDYEETMYVNTPIFGAGAEILGGLRVSYSLAQIKAKVVKIQSSLTFGLSIYAVVIVSLTLALAANFAQPVEAIHRAARRISSGDLSHKVTVQGTLEFEQLAEALNLMTERLAHLEGLRRKYVSDVSHELRAPLAAIRSMAETLLLHGADDAELSHRYLPRIVDQTERLARLATQVLDLDQIESGAMGRSLSPVSLAEVIEEAVQTAVGGHKGQGAKVALEVAPGLPLLFADRDRLVQMVLNLVGNALAHTPSDGNVWVKATRLQSGEIEIEIKDTGKGIPESHLANLFERFYRVDIARTPNRGGAGLGLSIVKQIVEAHGGTIEVASTLGQGTSFFIRLPIEGGR